MTIEKNDKDKIVIELNKKEFLLIAYLIEKTEKKHQRKQNERVSTPMHKAIQKYVKENY